MKFFVNNEDVEIFLEFANNFERKFRGRPDQILLIYNGELSVYLYKHSSGIEVCGPNCKDFKEEYESFVNTFLDNVIKEIGEEE